MALATQTTLVALIRAVLVKGRQNDFKTKMGGGAFVAIGTGEFFKELREREKWGRASGESMVERFL